MNQRLAYAIVEFLKETMNTVKSDEKESLEVACQCISDVFNINTEAKELSEEKIKYWRYRI